MSYDHALSRRGFIIGAAGLAAMASVCTTPWLALADEKPSTETPYDATEQADLIVVGAGGAGLSAAVNAVDAGATRVIVLEMTGKTGGSLNLTSGSMSCAESVIQKEDGIEDTVDAYVADIIKTGTAYGGTLDEDMVRLYAEQDIPMFQWLWDHGLKDYEFSADKEGKRAVFAPEHELYGIPRTYKTRGTKNPDVYKSAAHEVIDTYVQGCDAIEVVYNATAVELVPNADGQVCSVVATGKDGAGTLYTGTHGVVMCTGGYGGNRKMMAKYNEYGGEYLIGCGAWSDGRGLQMMQKVGGTLVNMDAIPSFPMGLEEQDNPGHGQIASTYMWKAGAICVNKNGERFMNENDESPTVREEALIQQPDALQYDIFTDKIIADLQADRK
ncbi:MAG: FAD-binding protein, partial [Coriobacteriia bacterium]|nr:FAD-binding protein [Coriobacteriia bacterium]